MKWYYIDGPHRVGPITEPQWSELLQSGKVAADTLVWREGMEKWTPYSQLPGEVNEEESFEEELLEEEPPGPGPAARPELPPEAFEEAALARDYPVQIRETIGKAWKLFNRDLWLLVGATMFVHVIIQIGSTVPVVNLLMQFALNGVLMAGLYSLYLRRMRGEPAIMLDLFSGFESGIFKQAALKTLVATAVILACFIPVSAAAITLGFYDAKAGSFALNPDPLAQATLLLILLACSIPAVYFGFCWIFALPLIIDRRLPFKVAMRLSRRKVLQHPWRVSALITVAGLLAALPGIITFLGVSLSGIAPATLTGMAQAVTLSAFAVLLGMPLYIGSMLYLYEAIFNDPPPTGKKE